eukprot:gene8779-33645_t
MPVIRPNLITRNQQGNMRNPPDSDGDRHVYRRSISHFTERDSKTSHRKKQPTVKEDSQELHKVPEGYRKFQEVPEGSPKGFDKNPTHRLSASVSVPNIGSE